MLSTLLLSLALTGPTTGPSGDQDGLIAVRAGTIYVAEDDRVIRGGGVILINNGKIVGVGEGNDDSALPPGVRVVDYGPDASIIPGLIAISSGLGGFGASERTAEPGLSAADHFDSYGNYSALLAGGVTTAYIAPGQGRLIAGHGAVVKLGGAAGPGRVLSSSAAIHGSISTDARRTPGYWEPPVPATVDQGMGVERPQLPRTTMGAMIALRELMALAANPKNDIEYGPFAGADLSALLKQGLPWRMRAESESEVRALIEFFGENDLRLLIDGASSSASMAKELAQASKRVGVVVYSSARTNARPFDYGKGEEANWPDQDLAATLSAAGVPVILAQPRGHSVRDLLFHASVARRGGMSAEDALTAITSRAARALGVHERVGSLGTGKDADFVVLNGEPLASGSSVIATWVDGDLAHQAKNSGPVVLEVDHLYVGDGQVLSPGQLLMNEGRIIEVGRRVAHPNNCTVVRGTAAMPGMIDALGHLGLEGSNEVPPTRFKMAQIVEPGDFADRRVAQAGVTTVVMTPRKPSNSGAPAMAYKPAGEDVEAMVISDPAALHVSWLSASRPDAGRAVLALLEKGKSYKEKWEEYEAELAAYVPPAPEPEAEAEEAKEEGKEEEADDEKKDEGDKKEKKKKKKKGEDPPKPITGSWLANVEQEGAEAIRLRMQVTQAADGGLEARVRCDAISSELILMKGQRVGHGVELNGLGTNGRVSLSAKTEEAKLKGSISSGDKQVSFEADQTSTEIVVARRTQAYEEQAETERPPKGSPKAPRVDEDLEPVRAALEGHGTFVVQVEREDEILACVAAFEAYGVKPVLLGASDAWKVKDKLVGRVRGILLSHQVVDSDPKRGTETRNRYADLTNAGIDVAFHSAVEEGAAQLPEIAAYAVSQGMSASGAVRALTSGAARMMSIQDRVGTLRSGLDADVLLLDGNPMDPGTRVQRVWVNGKEVLTN